MSITDEDLKKLREPFPYATIGWRVGAVSRDKTRGQAIPFIDARDVQNRLDEVVGPAGWQNRFEPAPNGGGVLCTIEINVGGVWVAKQDGAQQAERDERADREGKEDKISVKSALSNSFKRAGVMWGIARYLHNYVSPWVELRDDGRYLKEKPLLPDHMLPEAERRGGSPSQDAPPTEVPSHTEPQTGTDCALATVATPSPAKPMYDSSVAGDMDDPSAEPETAGKLHQSSIAGDIEDPSAPPKQRSLLPRTDLPVMGTAEAWSALSSQEKETISILSSRIEGKIGLTGVREYLTNGKGATGLPTWARESLLKNLNLAAGVQ